MSDLVPTDGQGITGRPPRSRSIDQGLAMSEAKYMKPTQHPPWEGLNFRELVRLTDTSQRISPERGAQALALGFDPAGIERYVELATGAIDGPVDPAASRVIIGLLAAGYAFGRPADMGGYLSTLLYDVLDMGFTPHVLSAACQKVRRSLKYLPSCAELLSACTEAKEALDANRRTALLIQRRLDNAKEALTYRPKLVESVG